LASNLPLVWLQDLTWQATVDNLLICSAPTSDMEASYGSGKQSVKDMIQHKDPY